MFPDPLIPNGPLKLLTDLHDIAEEVLTETDAHHFKNG